MVREEGKEFLGRMTQVMGASVGTQVVTPARDALWENYLTHWDFPKFGLQCREAAPADRLKSKVDTWQKHGQRYIRLCHKQNEVHFHTLRTSKLRKREFSYTLL